MRNSNDHIKKYLDYYLEDEPFPNYAVLIKSSWGAGKTHFIRQYLEGRGARGKQHAEVVDWLEGCKKYVVVYVSLYGAKNRLEMDGRVEDALHPVLKGDALKVLASGTRTVASLASTLSGNPLPGAICDASLLFADETLEKLKKRKKKLVVVFDDIERTDMSLPELLGYLNEYVEHMNIPCILLADKEKLEEAEACQKDKRTLQSISSTLEKVVGKEFQLQTAFDDVWNCWLTTEASLLGDRAKNVLQNSRDDIRRIFEASEKSNFRALRHTLLDFQRFLKDVDPDCLTNLEFCKLLAADFVAHQYAYHTGLLDPKKMLDLQSHEAEEIAKAMKSGTESSQTPANESEPGNKKSYNDFRKTFDGIRRFTALNDTETACGWFNIWKEWLQNSTMEPAQVNALIKRSIWYDGRDEYCLRKMLEWTKLNKEESRLAYNAFEKNIAGKKLNNPVLMMDLFVTMNWLIHKGALKKSAVNFRRKMEKYARSVGKKLEYAHLDNWKEWKKQSSEYKAYEPEVEDFYQLLNRLLNGTKKDVRGKQEKSLWSALTGNGQLEFYEVCGWIASQSANFDLLSFAGLNPEKFCRAYMSIDRNKQNRLLDSLKERYVGSTDVENVKRLNEERVFLEELKAKANAIFENERPVKDPYVFGLRCLINDIEEILGMDADKRDGLQDEP